MGQPTRTVQKSANVNDNIATTTQDNDSTTQLIDTDPENEQKTLQGIYKKLSGLDKKLSGLDRIENKLDTLDSRLDLLEARVGKIEDENDSEDVKQMHKNVEGLRNSNIELQKRIEILENKDRQVNVKILSLPVNSMETKPQLHGKILDILKHINPQISSANVSEVRRLQARGQAPNVGQASASATISQVSPPVLVKMSNASLAQETLREANKKIKTYTLPTIRIVDDVCKTTQDKRATLIPKMKNLRKTGMFAFIPFGPVAKLVYKEGAFWKTEYPEQ